MFGASRAAAVGSHHGRDRRGADSDRRRISGRGSAAADRCWKRGDLFDRTGLAWQNPSPNLRSLTEALLYPGVALLEATNVSVGRGTERPFERVGAPWIQGPKLAAALTAAGLPGARFTATSFTPTSSAFAGKPCEGVEIHLDDRQAFDPVRTGLALARALITLYPADFQPKGVLLLLGNQAAYDGLLRGDPLEGIAAAWAPGLAAFAPARARSLLYP